MNEKKSANPNGDIAVLYRYISTYYVAQGKKEETLASLENMLAQVEKIRDDTSDKRLPHNTAWYFLRYMEHERYNPVREEKRFVIIKDKMEKMAK